MNLARRLTGHTLRAKRCVRLHDSTQKIGAAAFTGGNDTLLLNMSTPSERGNGTWSLRARQRYYSRLSCRGSS